LSRKEKLKGCYWKQEAKDVLAGETAISWWIASKIPWMARTLKKTREKSGWTCGGSEQYKEQNAYSGYDF